MTISGTPVFSGLITPVGLNTPALIQPAGGATLGWVGNVFQGTGVYELVVDASVFSGSDQFLVQGYNQILPSGSPEAELYDSRTAPPGIPLLQEDGLIIQYGGYWQLTQTAGTIRAVPCAIYRVDAGLAGPVAKGTIQPPNTSTNNLLASITTPGAYVLSVSVRNMLASDTVAIWETVNAYATTSQQNASQNNPAGAVPGGQPTILKNDRIIVGQGCTANFFLKQTALGSGHAGTFPTFDWSISQLG